jgi:hypothetical protein
MSRQKGGEWQEIRFRHKTLEDRTIFHSLFIKIRTDDVVFCLTQKTLALSVRVCARTGEREFLRL